MVILRGVEVNIYFVSINPRKNRNLYSHLSSISRRKWYLKANIF